MGVLLVALLPTALATDSLGVFKQHECINLLQTCSNCTFINISSIIGPDSLQTLPEVEMTKLGTSYNYTYCNNSKLGTYIVTGYGDLNGVKEVWKYSFIVTPAGGAENNTTLFIVMVISSLVLLLLAFIFKNNIFSLISGFAFLGTGVYGMIYGFGDITNLYTRIISYIIIGIGALITIVSSLDFIQEMSGGDAEPGSVEDDDEF
jgi:hypothetical protein